MLKTYQHKAGIYIIAPAKGRHRILIYPQSIDIVAIVMRMPSKGKSWLQKIAYRIGRLFGENMKTLSKRLDDWRIMLSTHLIRYSIRGKVLHYDRLAIRMTTRPCAFRHMRMLHAKQSARYSLQRTVGLTAKSAAVCLHGHGIDHNKVYLLNGIQMHHGVV